MTPTILVAGIGNIFFGDDGFGCEVAQRLARRALPAHVAVRDFGIRGYDLAMRLDDPWDAVILVDTMARPDRAPGTLTVIEPAIGATSTMEPHAIDPVRVLAQAYADRPPPRTLRLVACQPASLEAAMELSPEVAAAIDRAVELIERLIAEVARA